jgi:glycosyltransferase involved in cell wall biosynthesis
MKETGQVLVIIPTHNRASLLPQAVESVLAQEHQEVQTLIVDDGSTDETPRVCEFYTRNYRERIYYVYQRNRGCASARNRGLDLIDEKRNYVCFLDSDDRLLPGKLTREVELLRCHPEADFTYADSIVFDEAKQQERLQPVAASRQPGRFAIEHFITNEAKCGALLYRSLVFKKLRFREDLRYNEDSELLQRVAIEHKGVYCPEPSCWVRWHGDSKSRNFLEIQRAVLRASLDILEAYPDFYASFAGQADGRIQAIKRSLFRQLMLSEHWNEASAYAASPLEKLLVAIRSNGYYWMRRQVGAALAKLRVKAASE